MKYFASDNNSGVHPKIMRALRDANAQNGRGGAPSYGDDAWTQDAARAVKAHFGPQAEPFFVFSGTGANVLALSALLAPYDGIICADNTHIVTDECAAVEGATGCKLYTVPARSGKLHPDDCRRFLELRSSVHHARPRVVSVTQGTELGTLYSVAELKNIAAFCRQNGLFLHMDGARLANAAAALNLPLAALSSDIGVDILSFGGAKNGLLLGEAVIALNPDLIPHLGYLRKHQGQLMAKMRFISAQFITYLDDGLWKENATQANAMARLLAGKINDLPFLRLTRPVEMNAVFARLPRPLVTALQKDYYFYVWDEEDEPNGQINCPEVRWMTSFSTTEADIAEFAAAIQRLGA